MIRQLTLLPLLVFSFALSAEEYPPTDRWDYAMIGFKLEDEINPKPKGGIVMTGSSSMRFWDHRIHEDLKPLSVVSKGFGGSNMNDVLTYLDLLVLSHDPRAVVIYEGDNDVAQGVPVPTIVDAYQKTIARIHEHNKQIRIYLLSVKPSVLRESMWPTMQAVNKELQDIAASDQRISYIDVATPMLNPDGSANESLLISDGLHMNQQGYDIWRDTVAPFLLEREAKYEFSR